MLSLTMNTRRAHNLALRPSQASFLSQVSTPMSKAKRKIENQARVPWAAWWPLILYFFLTLAISAAVFFLVDQNNFATNSRRPVVRQADGTLAILPYMFLQSDVTTLISFSLTVLRFVGVLSVGTLTWRCIFFLMGKEEGIPIRDIKWIVGFGLPKRSQGTQTAALALVAAILLTEFPAQFSSPILTGSITWGPSTYFVPGLKPVTGIPSATFGVSWTNYRTYRALVNVVAQKAAGLASVVWTSDDSASKSMTRVLPMIQYLPNGTVLVNVTTPYFAIDSLEWVQNVSESVTSAQISRLFGGNNFTQSNAEGPLFALIPDSQWGPQMSNNTFPLPHTLSETRLLSVLLDHISPNASCSHNTGYCGEIPSTIGFFARRFPLVTNCYAFARITYRAGAAVCHHCRSSHRFVYSDTASLELQEDVMTTEALAMMFIASQSMVFGNFSLPSPINNIDNYITEGLSRSYQASWAALHQTFGRRPTSVATNVVIPVPSSRADVQKWRIFAWMLLNIMFTLSGVISFIVIRAPVIIDVAIATMLLETDDAIRTHPNQLGNLAIVAEEDEDLRLRLTYDGDQRILTVVDHSSLPSERHKLTS